MHPALAEGLQRTLRFARLRLEAGRAMASAFLLLPLAAAPRLWAWWSDQGVFWPDEIYQTLEQAHRLAFGYGMVPWEFREGARSWVFPGMLGGVLKLASLIGLHTGPDLVRSAKLVMVLSGLWAVYASMRLAERIGGAHAALFAGIFSALFPASIVYGARCMTEMASAPLVVTAAWLALDGGWKKELAAGALAALAIYLRYQNGLLAVGFLLMLVLARRWKDALAYGASATVVGLLGGLLDKLTWGHWFHSFGVYVKFNLIEGRASGWGVADYDYYAKTLWTSTGWPLVLLGLGLILVFTRARVLPIFVLLYVGAHNAIPHKEYRFLMPIMPILFALSGAGLGWLLERIPTITVRGNRVGLGGWIATWFAVAVGLQLAQKTSVITFEEMGQSVGSPDGKWKPWHHEEGPNLAFWEAGQHNDLCGMAMVGTPLISSGGYSYLHKNVPLINSMDPSTANYLAMPRRIAVPQGWRMVARFPDYVLVKRDGPCTPAPWFQQMFP
jgi:GPI mannosyltransferase 3